MPPELRRERGPPRAAGRLEGVRRRERARQEVERQARVALRFQPLRGGLLDAALQRVVGRRREAVRVAVPVRRSRSSRVRVRVREALVAPDGRGRARARGAGDDARGGREVVPVARELGVPPDALRGRRAEDAPVDGRPAVADPAPRERRARPAAAAAAREEALDEGDLRGVGSSCAVAAAAGGTPRARAVADAAVVRRGHELGDRAVDQRRAGRVAGRGEAVEGLARDDERPVDHRTNDFRGGLFETSGVTGDRLFDLSPSSEKPLGTPGGRGGVRNCPGLCETRGGVGTGGGGGMAEASGAGMRELNASNSASFAA